MLNWKTREHSPADLGTEAIDLTATGPSGTKVLTIENYSQFLVHGVASGIAGAPNISVEASIADRDGNALETVSLATGILLTAGSPEFGLRWSLFQTTLLYEGPGTPSLNSDALAKLMVTKLAINIERVVAGTAGTLSLRFLAR